MASAKLKIYFDLDGTLIDVAPRHYRVYSEVTCELGGTPLEQPAYWDLKRSKTTWPQIFSLSHLDESLLAEFLKTFISKIESIDYLKNDKLLPAAVEQVEQCSSNSQCYLISLRRNHVNLQAQLNWLNLTPHFYEILSGHSENDGSDIKTDIIQKTLSNSPGIIIGDTEADIKTGKTLGLTTVAVLSGIRNRQFLEALHPDHLIDDISQLQLPTNTQL